MNNKWIAVSVFTLLLMASIIGDKVNADSHNFPVDLITMDVVKQSQTGGGTWICPSVQACYIKILEAEARGAAQYCESITIKRNGSIVWQRQYQNKRRGYGW